MLATLTGTVPGVVLPEEPQPVAADVPVEDEPEPAEADVPETPEAVTEAEVVEAQEDAAADER
jgi:hypothetical protein